MESGNPLPHLLVLVLLLTQTWTVRANKGPTTADEERDKESDAETPCEVKTVTVSTLPVLRENEFSFTGAASGNVVGGGGGGGSAAEAGGAAAGAAAAAGGGAGGESRLLLFVRTDLPGRISVMDDLDNTALPYFTLGKNCSAALTFSSAKTSTHLFIRRSKITLICPVCLIDN